MINAAFGTHHTILHLQEKFAPNTPDEEWLPALGRDRPWTVVTLDRNIRRNPHRRRCWEEARLTTFFLKDTWAHQSFEDLAWRFPKLFPKLVQKAEEANEGTGHVVFLNGEIERL